MAIRDVSADIHSYNSLEEFLSSEGLPVGRFVVYINGVPVDFEYDDRGHDTTMVLLHPALSPKILKLPMFIGRGISAPAPVNRLFVADPTLNMHDKLLLSWFAGNSKQPDLQSSLGKAFEKVTRGKRTIYFGLSGGGFAALTYSAMHPGSVAIPVNPQTNIPDYLPKAVCAWTNSAWGMNNKEDADSLSMPPVITNVQEVYAKPVDNQVVYIQNTGDTGHVKSHWEPFREAFESSNTLTEVLVYSGPGHVAPPEPFLSELLVTVSECRDWDSLDLSGIKASPLRQTVPTGPQAITDARVRRLTRDVSKLTDQGHHVFSDFAEIVGEPMRPGLNSLFVNDSWFDFVYDDNGADVTLVTFTAAMPVSNETYPVISNRALAKTLGVNFIGFADAAQGGEEALSTYWHLSTSKVDTQAFVPAIIRHAVDSGSGKNLIFFGASAGGFAALTYGAQFEGSAVVAMNPRINLLHAPYLLPAYTGVAYAGMDSMEIRKGLPVNVAATYSEPQGNFVVYVQNLQDENNVRHHYKHFLKVVEDRDDVHFIAKHWGDAATPPNEAFVGPIQALIGNAPEWGPTSEAGPLCSCNAYRLHQGTVSSDPHCVSHGYVFYEG